MIIFHTVPKPVQYEKLSYTWFSDEDDIPFSNFFVYFPSTANEGILLNRSSNWVSSFYDPRGFFCVGESGISWYLISSSIHDLQMSSTIALHRNKC